MKKIDYISVGHDIGDFFDEDTDTIEKDGKTVTKVFFDTDVDSVMCHNELEDYLEIEMITDQVESVDKYYEKNNLVLQVNWK